MREFITIFLSLVLTSIIFGLLILGLSIIYHWEFPDLNYIEIFKTYRIVTAIMLLFSIVIAYVKSDN